MNTNKQLTKGYKMRKIAMMIGLISVLATSANAVTRDNSYIGGMSNSDYNSPTVRITIW